MTIDADVEAYLLGVRLLALSARVLVAPEVDGTTADEERAWTFRIQLPSRTLSHGAGPNGAASHGVTSHEAGSLGAGSLGAGSLGAGSYSHGPNGMRRPLDPIVSESGELSQALSLLQEGSEILNEALKTNRDWGA